MVSFEVNQKQSTEFLSSKSRLYTTHLLQTPHFHTDSKGVKHSISVQYCDTLRREFVILLLKPNATKLIKIKTYSNINCSFGKYVEAW